MRTIEFNNEDIKECKIALLRQDLTSLQSAFLMQHITNLEQALNEIKEYIHSEEFFLLMNSNSMNDKNKTVCEDYFKAQGKLDNILDKVLGDDK